jgi:N-acylneuraminate cytidylyltransferase
MTKRVFGFVFARGGSKGIPGKNLKLLAGKPLIGYAIETALATHRCEQVIVSTDSAEIAEAARGFGAATPFLRPAELASDSAAEWDAWRHAIEFVKTTYGEFDIFVSLPPTSPFRSTSDVTDCIDVLERDNAADAVITGRRAERSPYFNMVRLDNKNYAHVVIRPDSKVVRRQDTPEVFDVTTVAYVAHPEFILRANSLWDGNVRLVEIPAERALDIDTPFDFMIAECIAQSRAASGIPREGRRAI